MCMLTGALLEQATRSACQTDRAAAHWVVAGAGELDRQRGHAEELVVRLLALHAPVATDLRRVVSALWIVGDVHRMGVLAIHVAQATLRRYPEPVLPVTVRPVFARCSPGWARIGEQLAGQAAAALRQRDVALAQGVSARNPEMDRPHRQLLAATLDPSWPYGVAAAIDVLSARPVL
jgi:phosphate transport system protein